ncbi:MAG: type VI secretion system baseplate subunit TssK [Isosphaeraceae bacterium]|nr:type VI secretion system baseplate subunit TssK [Isosphaeraceae bacterium]
MPGRAVHWHEGMFLRPHHFQVADRCAHEALRASEDWYHPFNWGVRLLDLDRDAIGNYTVVLRSCEARFKDGTKLSIPGDANTDPIELRSALAGPSGAVTVYLAVPALQAGRANVEPHPTADGPRYWIENREVEDENTGGDEQEILLRRVRCRLLLSNQDQTGYEVLPLARIERSAQAEAPPQLDLSYVPPLLCIDAWPPLWRSVQALHHQIAARIDQLATQLIDRGISFDSQVPGDAERMLKLAVLNGAFSELEALAYLRGLHPLAIYHELCRLVGQLAIFTEVRRPPNLPRYDHEDLGGCFQAVIKAIQLGLETVAPIAFEKRYFERVGERLQVSIEPAWTAGNRALFLGVETELDDQQCQALLDAMDMKLGSGAQVEHYFAHRVQGLRLAPVARPPRALPASAGVVYYQIERDPTFWRDVVETHTLGLRMNMARARFEGSRLLAVAVPGSGRVTNLQFALYVI